MKRNPNKSDYRSNPGYTIHDYGHDRTVFSLGNSGQQALRRRQRRRRLLVWLVPVALLTAGGILAWSLLGQDNNPAATTKEPTLMPTATANTPAAATTTATSVPTTAAATSAATVGAAERASRLTTAGNEALAVLKGKTGRFAIFYQNLQNGEKWQSNADQPFVAASSIKLGINTYLYTKMASGEIKADEILTYDNRPYPTGDYEAGTGTIQNQPNGTRMTVRQTSGLSIRISDNCGTNMVIRRLGGIDAVNVFLSGVSAVVDYRKTVSYKNYAGTAVSGRHRSCAMDLGLHAVKLYQLWQANPAVYQPLVDDLCQTEFDFGVQKGVPAGIKVAHKIGTNGTYNAENDVAIIWANEPYVLCIMTEMGSAAAAHQIQADLSGIFYNYILSCAAPASK